MRVEKIEIEKPKNHWSHADIFGDSQDEYVKSLVHYKYSIGYHTHSFYEVNIVLKGRGRHYIEEMSCDAEVGSVFIIPPNIRHGYMNDGDFDVYHLLIHRDFFSAYFAEFLKTVGFSLLFETEPYLRAQYHENMFLILSVEELNVVLNDAEAINTCKNMVDSNIYINAIAKKIIAYLCMLVTQRQGADKIIPQAKKELRSITDSLNYIHQNFEERITIELLAERLNMSRSTFIRQFTKICGCSPYDYIKQYRINKAKEYLKNSSETVTTVAQKCGFYDASHLRKCLNAKSSSKKTI